MSKESPHNMLVFRFPSLLKEGVILSRPNRFIMMVDASGETLRCHCPTTGKLGDLSLAGLPCLYSSSRSASRKKTLTDFETDGDATGAAWN
jgi:sugar fermentation stimulation protein A